MSLQPSAALAATSPSRQQADLIAAAKLWLITADGRRTAAVPYLATALYSLVPVISPSVATMSADRSWRLYANPGWLARESCEAVAVRMAHVVWHLLADHAGRAQDVGVGRANAPAWRTAADLTIDDVLPWPAFEVRPHPHLERGRSAEEYFARLSSLPVADSSAADSHAPPTASAAAGKEAGEGCDASCGSACDGIDRSHELPGRAEVPAVGEGAAHAIRTQVAIAFRDHPAAFGSTAAQWRRWVEQILEPRVPWQQVLGAAVRRGVAWVRGHTDYTYSRPSRRQAALPHVVIPALRRPVGCLAVVVDTSGSVDDGLLAQALGELDAVLAAQAVPGAAVTVLAVDAQVHTVARVRDVAALELVGGGGTDMAAGIAAALQSRPRPQLIIVLTDGFTPWPSQRPGVPTIVVLLGRDRHRLPDTPAWAERVEVVPGG